MQTLIHQQVIETHGDRFKIAITRNSFDYHTRIYKADNDDFILSVEYTDPVPSDRSHLLTKAAQAIQKAIANPS